MIDHSLNVYRHHMGWDWLWNDFGRTSLDVHVAVLNSLLPHLSPVAFLKGQYIMYTSDLVRLIEHHRLSLHFSLLLMILRFIAAAHLRQW